MRLLQRRIMDKDDIKKMRTGFYYALGGAVAVSLWNTLVVFSNHVASNITKKE